MAGRNDGNTKVIFPTVDIADSPLSQTLRPIEPGDYVVVQASSCAARHCKILLSSSALWSFDISTHDYLNVIGAWVFVILLLLMS
jgi:hypothetical protein